MRLGVYSDQRYRRDGDLVSTHQAFIRFVVGLRTTPEVDEVVVFGRIDPEPGRSAYEVTGDAVRVVALPDYPSVTDVVAQVRSARRTMAIFRRELPALDAVWIFGPHPMAVVLAAVARRQGTPAYLGVRQDYPAYIRNRLPGPGWRWAVPVAHALDRSFRRLARTAPTVALGEELAERYRAAGGPGVLSTGFSLVGRSDLVDVDAALDDRWRRGVLRVLAVGRLAPEKNPSLLIDVVAGLRRRDRRWRLTVVGDRPLEGAVRQRAEELGVADAVDLVGYVPSGPDLWEIYRSSHAFLHVSFTEGLPQVLWEAQAAGLPVVATDVGGVRGALGGDTAILIPPGDAQAAIAALERLRDEPSDREGLIRRGLGNAAHETMEEHLQRIVRFFSSYRTAPSRAWRSRMSDGTVARATRSQKTRWKAKLRNRPAPR